jgi:hypothetical protein
MLFPHPIPSFAIVESAHADIAGRTIGTKNLYEIR